MQNPSSPCPRCQSPIPADAPGGICPSCALLGVAEPTDPAQAAAAGTPTLEELAAAFPEYEVLEVIGQGGMGVVFKARQPRLDRLVAVKILPPALAAQPGFAERFSREARALARLAHPHIVAVYDFGERAGFYYLTMEYVNGVNLRQAMRAGVTPVQALALVPRICEALQFAHDRGVLHRDIKPENILLDTAGTPKLADFGIAKFAGEEAARTSLTATGAALGTAAYMAPEQVEKPATVDHRADIYSLGVVLYEMLTGELPLGRFAAPSEKSSVNRGVDEVVMRALEKERERRQQSATEMKTQVEHASAGGGIHPVARAKEKDIGFAYLFWFLFGLMGGHKFYLRQYGWAWLYFFTGGLFFIGWFIDLFTLPAQVRAHNATVRALPLLPPSVVWNPWPRRIFLLAVVLIVVPTLMVGVGLVLPYFASRSNRPPPPQDLLMEPRIRFVHQAQAIRTPGTESMKIVGLAPFGWMMDFTLDLRDSAGTRNAVREMSIPRFDFLAAQRIPSGRLPTRGLEFGAEWQITSTADGTTELHTHYGRAPDFKVNWDPKTGGSPMIPDPGISNGGTIPGLDGYRWTQHPDRQRYGELKLPVEIPFVFGRAPGKPDVQLFIKATARPMKPDEHANEMVIYMEHGHARFQRLRTDDQRARQHPKYRELSAIALRTKAELQALEAAPDTAGRNEKIATLKQRLDYEDYYARWVYLAVALPADNEDFSRETPELQTLKFRIAELKAQMRTHKMSVDKGNGLSAIVTRPESVETMASLDQEAAALESQRDTLIQKLNSPLLEKP